MGCPFKWFWNFKLYITECECQSLVVMAKPWSSDSSAMIIDKSVMYQILTMVTERFDLMYFYKVVGIKDRGRRNIETD